MDQDNTRRSNQKQSLCFCKVICWFVFLATILGAIVDYYHGARRRNLFSHSANVPVSQDITQIQETNTENITTGAGGKLMFTERDCGISDVFPKVYIYKQISESA